MTKSIETGRENSANPYAGAPQQAAETIRHWPSYLLSPVWPRVRHLFPEGATPERTGIANQPSSLEEH